MNPEDSGGEKTEKTRRAHGDGPNIQHEKIARNSQSKEGGTEGTVGKRGVKAACPNKKKERASQGHGRTKRIRTRKGFQEVYQAESGRHAGGETYLIKRREREFPPTYERINYRVEDNSSHRDGGGAGEGTGEQKGRRLSLSFKSRIRRLERV